MNVFSHISVLYWLILTNLEYEVDDTIYMRNQQTYFQSVTSQMPNRGDSDQLIPIPNKVKENLAELFSTIEPGYCIHLQDLQNVYCSKFGTRVFHPKNRWGFDTLLDFMTAMAEVENICRISTRGNEYVFLPMEGNCAVQSNSTENDTYGTIEVSSFRGSALHCFFFAVDKPC